MRTVFFVIQQGFGARILLQTKILETLIENEIEIVILTNAKTTIHSYLKGRGIEGVKVEQINVNNYKKKNYILETIFIYSRYFSVNSKTTDDNFVMEWKDAKRIKSLKKICMLSIARIISLLMRHNKAFLRLIINLENVLFTKNVNSWVFEKYCPNAMILTSIGTFDDDRYLMREARRHDVKVLSYILSWDNTTVRGLGTNISDKIYVWSDVMKKELIKLHGIASEKISVAGVPHYDFYTDEKSLYTKEHLSEIMSFSSQKRLLLLATKSPNGYLYNADIAELICSAIHEGKLPEDCHLIARLHPIYFRKRNNKLIFAKELEEWDRLNKIYGGKCLSVDKPEMIKGDLNIFMPDKEIIKLASILKHSCMVINMFSTLNIEASIFDKPSINVSFQYKNKMPKGTKVERFNIKYDEIQTHNQRIINSEGTVIVHTQEELIKNIKIYLENPHLRKLGRKKIIENECGVNLGCAGRFIGNDIAGELLHS